jgi:hypothetical protein
MPNLIQRVLRLEPGITIGQWCWDRVAGNWPALVALVGGGGMSYLASVTSWVNRWGPVAWGATGLLSVLLIAGIYLVYGTARAKIGIAKYIEKKIETSTVNVLAPSHVNERIELTQFYHPYLTPTEHARFENCDLMGPAYVAVTASTFDGCIMNDCQIVIVRPMAPVSSAILLKFCTFVRCRLYRVVWLMDQQTYLAMPPEARAGMSVISEGTPTIRSS